MRSGIPVRDARRVVDGLLEAVGPECAERDGEGAVGGADFPKGLAGHDAGGGFLVGGRWGEEGGFFVVGRIGRHR